jgi:hypothetical protein
VPEVGDLALHVLKVRRRDNTYLGTWASPLIREDEQLPYLGERKAQRAGPADEA